MLNSFTTQRYNYYFDSKITQDVRTPKFWGKTYYIAYGIILFTIVALFFGNIYLNQKERETQEIQSVEKFIYAFMEIYRVEGINDKEIRNLSKRLIEFSKKYEIDPALVLAIISVESSFDKNAVSPVGARGLMQLMPDTAKLLAKELGIKYHGLNGIHDIEYNIMLGTYYLAKLADKYQRNMHLYLTAYNYGPSKVDKMIREKNRIPRDYYSKIINRYKQFSF